MWKYLQRYSRKTKYDSSLFRPRQIDVGNSEYLNSLKFSFEIMIFNCSLEAWSRIRINVLMVNEAQHKQILIINRMTEIWRLFRLAVGDFGQLG